MIARELPSRRRSVGTRSGVWALKPEMLFLDTEFCASKRGAELLSIGIVGTDTEFYAELDAASMSRLARRVKMSRFLGQTVLPQFGHLTGVQHSLEEIAFATASWLRSRSGDAIEVVYDYSEDFTLLERLLEISDPPLLTRLVPVHVGYLLEDPSGEAAAMASWLATGRDRGLHRHHALSDALALRARFEAVHGP